MALNSYFTPLFLFVLSFLLVHIFGEAAGTNKNRWQINSANNPGNSQVLQGNMSTTPWPSLNQRQNQSTSLRHINQQPTWVQNGSNWLRIQNSQAINMHQNALVTTGSTPRNPLQNNMTNFRNMGQNVGFVSTINQQGNTNPNIPFLTNERNSSPGSNRFVPNQHNNYNNRGTSSAGPFSQNYGNSHDDSNGQSDGDVQDNELRDFSEILLSKDTNNVGKYVTINVQKMTSSRSPVDEAPLPLLTVDQAAYSIPSISQLLKLYNNYILETNQNEVYTAQEKNEESDLLDTILSTSVMQHTRNFLIDKGKLGRDPKDFEDLLRQIWFNMYSRGGGRIGSSGFEHVFLAEIKNNQISGLHSWIYFNEEEKKKTANYLGYMKKLDLGDKGAILKYHFFFHDKDKPVGTMFIGTSPELEMALYTTCFVLRADKICPLKLNGKRFIIRTYSFRYRGKNMIGSAFPEI